MGRMWKSALAITLLGSLLACTTEKEDPAADPLASGDCYYSSRKTVTTFDKVEGLIVLTTIVGKTEATIYQPAVNGNPYCACNLPTSFLQDSLRVVFSAQQKEVYANEKWKCSPMVLTFITTDPGKGTPK